MFELFNFTLTGRLAGFYLDPSYQGYNTIPGAMETNLEQISAVIFLATF